MIGAVQAFGMVLLGAGLSGCANSDELKARINGRWGPEPTIQANYVDAAAQNQHLVLSYLARNVEAERASLPIAQYWYEVAQWGFNIGRQDCEIYLDNLFRMSREKARNDNVLAAAATAAAAIITGTTHAQKPLSIAAAAFGLSIALNDAIFQSYLFTQAPGLVAKKVSDMQEDFRSRITPDKVNSASSAYNAIQSYYHICLPHAIEGVMLQKIADSNPSEPGATPVPLVGASRARRVLRTSVPSSAIRTPELK
jgi:hypothetical protein